MLWFWISLAVGAGLVIVLMLELLRQRHQKRLAGARKGFRQQREHLEADFFAIAGRSGRPRGLIWKNCDWDSEVVFARDRTDGKMIALVGVTIQFEAVEGGDMEGLAAVGNLRDASGVFFFERGNWRTAGKVVFNLNPNEALDHFQQQYERLEIEPKA
jgi:hypothetical protein